MDPLVSLAKGLGLGSKQRIIILNYHRVLASLDPFIPEEPDSRLFERQIEWLTSHFPVVSLPQALDDLDHGRIKEPTVVITFDDGYRNNTEIAIPILQRHKIRAAFFVVSDTLNNGIMWNDVIAESFRLTEQTQFSLNVANKTINFYLTDLITRRQQSEHLIQTVKYLPAPERHSFIDKLQIQLGVEGRLPQDLMMTTEQVKMLVDAGMTVGAHACTHDILTSLTIEKAKHEIFNSKQQLEKITECSVDFYAYPNGKLGSDYTVEHARLVESAGYRAGLSTQWGAIKAGDDRYQLPRLMPWHSSQIGFHMNIIKALFH